MKCLKCTMASWCKLDTKAILPITTKSKTNKIQNGTISKPNTNKPLKNKIKLEKHWLKALLLLSKWWPLLQKFTTPTHLSRTLIPCTMEFPWSNSKTILTMLMTLFQSTVMQFKLQLSTLELKRSIMTLWEKKFKKPMMNENRILSKIP